jgi:hypothetical protein
MFPMAALSWLACQGIVHFVIGRYCNYKSNQLTGVNLTASEPQLGARPAACSGATRISRGTDGLQTHRWRKADSNRWSHHRVSTTAATGLMSQPPASELDS